MEKSLTKEKLDNLSKASLLCSRHTPYLTWALTLLYETHVSHDIDSYLVLPHLMLLRLNYSVREVKKREGEGRKEGRVEVILKKNKGK